MTEQNSTLRLLAAIEKLRIAKQEEGAPSPDGGHAAMLRRMSAEVALFHTASSVEKRLSNRRRHMVEVFVDEGFLEWMTALNQVHYVGGLSELCAFMIRSDFLKDYSTGGFFISMWPHLPERLREATRNQYERESAAAKIPPPQHQKEANQAAAILLKETLRMLREVKAELREPVVNVVIEPRPLMTMENLENFEEKPS